MNNVTKFAKWFLENFPVDCMTCSSKVTSSSTRIGRMLLKLQLPLEKLQYVARFKKEGNDEDGDTVYTAWFVGCSRGPEVPSLYGPEAFIAELEYLTGEKAELSTEKRGRVDMFGQALLKEIERIAIQRKENLKLSQKWSILNTELTTIAKELKPTFEAIAIRITSSESWDEKLREIFEKKWVELGLDKLPIPKAPKPQK